MLALEILKDMELIVKYVQHNSSVAQDRKKIYADCKRTPQEFHVGEHVYVWVKSRKRYLRLGKYSKLVSWYCGPFEILEKVGPVAYQLVLPPTIKVHNVFHVYILKKYVLDATHVIEWNVI